MRFCKSADNLNNVVLSDKYKYIIIVNVVTLIEPLGYKPSFEMVACLGFNLLDPLSQDSMGSWW